MRLLKESCIKQPLGSLTKHPHILLLFFYPQLSPDGRFLAFIQPSKDSGVNSIFVTALPPSSGSSASTGSSSSSSGSSSSSRNDVDSSLMARGLLAPVQVTRTDSAVSDFFWTKDGSALLFAVDSGSGSENFHLYWVPLTIQSGGSSSSEKVTSEKGSSGSKNQQGGAAASVKVTPGNAVNLTPFPGEL